ncbi:MAG TPA: hypothetical protein VLV54_07440 [Thermoanaerobaculia bacterium]|nr:hypothetical protein [Thermoanaerobaculia bacterium]
MDERLSFDVEDLDRDALIDEAVRAVQTATSLEGLVRSTRTRSFGPPEADVLSVLPRKRERIVSSVQ